ncbi:MAG: protein-L-isoaspartate(D-aspartate) O-methyltransferase [bacterium]
MVHELKSVVLLFFLAACSDSGAGNFSKMREDMVRTQIEARGVRDRNVLAAMRTVPRHLFVDKTLFPAAYGDHPLPIGEEQTISQPYIVALMTELIDPAQDDRILEIGTGSGYQAAVLAEIVKEVYTVEIIPSLSERAQDTLKKLGYKNVLFKTGDGFLGWEEFAPFDGIIVTCAPEEIPPALVAQLKEGGKMVIPVGVSFQKLQVVEKIKGKIEIIDNISVRFVPMTGLASGEMVLPAPEHKGKISVEEAISKRKSVRNYKNQPLSISEVSQMLWAAGGLCRPENGKTDAVSGATRSFPSAGGRYPFEIYLFAGNVKGIPPGLYRYEWEEHRLKILQDGDLRKALAAACLGQDFINDAPATIVFTGIEKKLRSGYGERGIRYSVMDIGHAGQNIYLQAGALGLGTVAVGAFNEEDLKKLIGVKGEIPLYVFPFGQPL